MSNTTNHETKNVTLPEALSPKQRKATDRAVRAWLSQMENENTLVPDSPSSRLKSAVKAYNSAKPILTAIASLPVVPRNWRAALLVFTQSLDALVAAAPSLTTLTTTSALSAAPAESDEFKAGKDL